MYVDFQVVGPCLGTVSEIQGKKATVNFSGFSAEIADKHNFSFSSPCSIPKPISQSRGDPKSLCRYTQGRNAKRQYTAVDHSPSLNVLRHNNCMFPSPFSSLGLVLT